MDHVGVYAGGEEWKRRLLPCQPRPWTASPPVWSVDPITAQTGREMLAIARLRSDVGVDTKIR
jgi:hypothetical protein